MMFVSIALEIWWVEMAISVCACHVQLESEMGQNCAF